MPIQNQTASSDEDASSNIKEFQQWLNDTYNFNVKINNIVYINTLMCV